MIGSLMTTSRIMEEGLSFMDRGCPEEDTLRLKMGLLLLKGFLFIFIATNRYIRILGLWNGSKWKGFSPSIGQNFKIIWSKKVKARQLYLLQDHQSHLKLQEPRTNRLRSRPRKRQGEAEFDPFPRFIETKVNNHASLICLLRSVRGTYLTLVMKFSYIFPFFLLISIKFWVSCSPPTGMIIIPSSASCSIKARGTLSAAAPTWIASNFISLSKTQPCLPSPCSILICYLRS